MKKLILILAASFVMAVSSPDYAGTFSCNATVSRVLVYKSGAVNIRHSGRNDYTIICNLKSDWKDVSVTTCALWVGILQGIKEWGTFAQFYYDTDVATPCTDLPVYGLAPSPVYIGEI